MAVVLVAAVALVLVVAPVASAAKFFDSTVGVPTVAPGLGATFANAPRDVAVNDPGGADAGAFAAAQGDFYVVDDANHRIQRMNADGSFDLAWGADVVVGGTTNFEICAVAANCKSGPGTAAPTAPTNNLLNGGLDNPQGVAVDQDSGNVYVSDRDNRRVNQYNANGVFIRSFGFDVLATVSEVQTGTVTAASGSFTLSYGAGGTGVGTTGDIPVDSAAGVVQAALNGLTNISAGGGSVTVTGPVSGVYTITFAGTLANTDVPNQVAAASSAGDPLVGGSATSAIVHHGSAAAAVYEVCDATHVCKVGVGVANGVAGQFGATTTAGHYRLDVSKPDGNPATGTVYLANTGSQRVETYNLDGTSPSNFGSSAQFASSQPLGVAVDSAGVVYATDGGNGGPLTRYSTATSSFLAPIEVAALTNNINGRNGVEVDGSTGNLFVVSGNSAAGLFEIATPGGTPSVAGIYPTTTPAGEFTPAGVGVNAGSGKVFMPATNTSGAFQGRTVVFDGDGLGPIAITVHPVTTVGGTTATLRATINPSPNGPTGQPTTYRFEVSKNGVDWTRVTSDALVPPNGDTNANAVVEAQATGLTAGQSYKVRVVASRVNNTGGTTSAEVAFMTAAAAPTVVNGATTSIREARATLNATVNPNNEATSYRFEYGSTVAYGNSAPIPDAALVTDNKSLGVNQTILGLEPGVTYHYRIVASNPNGISASGDRTFTTLVDQPAPPAGRAYELVSEGKGEPIDVVPSAGMPGGSQISSDGDALLHGLQGAPPNGEGGPVVQAVVTRRNSALSMWGMTSVIPPMLPATQQFDQIGKASFASDDLSRTLVLTNAVLTDDAWLAGRQQATYYVRDTGTDTYRLVTPAALPPAAPGYNASVYGGSTDLDQVLVETSAVLTLDAPTSGTKLYKWDDGTLSLQSVLPDGTPTNGSAAGSSTGGVTAPGSTSERLTGTLSSDGSAVFFSSPTSPPSAAAVYRREDNATVLVNAEENDNEVVAPGSAIYRMAVRDGSKVLFTSTQHLVEQDTNLTTGTTGTDLYMYTHSNTPATDENLTLLSLPFTPAGNTAVQGVIGTSEDGNRVYFVAQGQLTADAPVGTASKSYLWQSGDVTDSGDPELRYIGTITDPITLAWGVQSTAYPQGSVSADGRSLLLLTNAQLDPDRDNGGLRQIYRYGLADDKFTCVSCPETGLPSANARLRNWDTQTAPISSLRGVEPRWGVSADGGTVMFDTRDALVPEDVNGQWDVYVWGDGEPRLISTGRSSYPSTAVELSPDGDSAYFTTNQQLLARDTDDSYDIYVARVGGGFPDDPPPTPVVCEVLADGCQGPGAGEVVVQRGTESPSSDGNASVEGRRALTVGAVSSRARRSAARRGVLALRVRTDRAGQVAAVARARVGGRARRVARGSIRLPGAGSGVLRLRLDRAARQRLRSGRAVSMSVRVTSPGARARTIAVRLLGVKS